MPYHKELRKDALNAVAEYVYCEVEKHTGSAPQAEAIYKVTESIIRLLEIQLEAADLVRAA